MCDRSEPGDGLEGVVVIRVACPDGRLENELGFAGLAVATLQLSHLGAGAGEVHLWTNALRPGPQKFCQGVDEGQALWIEAPVVLVVEDAFDACMLVDCEDVCGGVANVIVFEYETPADGFGEYLPCAY